MDLLCEDDGIFFKNCILTCKQEAWTYLIEPEQRQGDIRGLDGSVSGSWQIRQEQREVVEVEGDIPIVDADKGIFCS